MQGMDLPNISIVVQWKATCDMCTLWQRFGRGGRGSGETATAILLVEKKDMEEERQSKAERAAKKRKKAREGNGTKRKANDELINNCQDKRPALQDRSLNGNNDDAHSEILGSQITLRTPVPIKDLKEERRALYKEGAVVEKAGISKKGKGKGRELEVAMDDYVNSQHLCFDCRHIVPILYFRNDKTRKSSYCFRVIFSSLKQHVQQRQIILHCAILPKRQAEIVAGLASPLFAAISAILKNSQSITSAFQRRLKKWQQSLISRPSI
jgi:superfamily II DNA helicase RecQ